MYALFAFGFEMAFCIHLRYLITAAPSAQMPRLIANANAWAMGLMVVVSLVGSYAVDRTSLGTITAMVVGAAALVPLIAHIAGRRHHAPMTARDTSLG